MNARGASLNSFHRRFGLAVLLVSACLIQPLAVWAENPARYGLADLKALEESFIQLAEQVRPSVVSIRCYEIQQPGLTNPSPVKLPISQGSGFVVDSEGYIATNRHVIEEADEISIIFYNGLRYVAEVVEEDIRSDLAILRIDAKGLTPVRFGSLANVRVNQWSFACGNPFGLAFDNYGKTSVTYGVVSALGRQMTRQLVDDDRVHYYGNLIETSATINPGNSGGPLFNLDGEVIGVVTAIETTSGVNEGHGYAIPIDNNTRRILKTLQTGEIVRYGFLGIEVIDLEPPISKRVADSQLPRGARIIQISPDDGPAAKSDLKIDDVVVEFNGTAVQNSDHLVRLVQYTPVGADVEIKYMRRNVKRFTRLQLADRNELLGVTSSRHGD